MKKLSRIALLSLVVGIGSFAGIAVPAGAAPAPAGETLVVQRDRGGLISRRSAEIRRLRADGRRVELRGECYSSCTMYLGLPNVCVHPQARLGFHAPRGVNAPLPADAFDHWSQLMARHYREPLRNWYLQEARHIRGQTLVLTGSQLIDLGYPSC